MPITEEPEAQIERLRYVLAQGLKEGSVAQALDWPGASSLPALLLNGSMHCDGIWYDRTTAYRTRRAGLDLRPDDWVQSETVVLTPLPALAHLSERTTRRPSCKWSSRSSKRRPKDVSASR